MLPRIASPRGRILLGKTRRGAEDRADEIEQAGIGPEQGKELHAGRKPGEEAVEGDEGLIGIAAPGERGEQSRHELGQKLAGAGTSRRAIAAEMPAPDHRGDLACAGRIGKGQEDRGGDR